MFVIVPTIYFLDEIILVFARTDLNDSEIISDNADYRI